MNTNKVRALAWFHRMTDAMGTDGRRRRVAEYCERCFHASLFPAPLNFCSRFFLPFHRGRVASVDCGSGRRPGQAARNQAAHPASRWDHEDTTYCVGQTHLFFFLIGLLVDLFPEPWVHARTRNRNSAEPPWPLAAGCNIKAPADRNANSRTGWTALPALFWV